MVDSWLTALKCHLMLLYIVVEAFLSLFLNALVPDFLSPSATVEFMSSVAVLMLQIP